MHRNLKEMLHSDFWNIAKTYFKSASYYKVFQMFEKNFIM